MDYGTYILCRDSEREKEGLRLTILDGTHYFGWDMDIDRLSYIQVWNQIYVVVQLLHVFCLI